MDLFEDILEQIGAQYLSDIKTNQFRDAAIKCAQNIENGKYTQSEWLDLMRYLTAQKGSKHMSIEQIKAFIKER